MLFVVLLFVCVVVLLLLLLSFWVCFIRGFLSAKGAYGSRAVVIPRRIVQMHLGVFFELGTFVV